MSNLNIALIALYRYRNFPIRIMHALLENAIGIQPHTIFLKNCESNIFKHPTPKEEEILIRLVVRIKPKIIGFSVLSPYADIVTHLTKLIKENSPSTIVVWGGIHPTISPESCIKEADIICIGEGEEAILELAKCLRDEKPYYSIMNLWIRKGEYIIKNPMRPLMQDLDSLPLPCYGHNAYYFIDSNKMSKKDPLLFSNIYEVQASRGCPFSCPYCINSLLKPLYKDLGSYVRKRSVNSVIDEIRKNSRADIISFADEIFETDMTWLNDFAMRYKKEIGLPFCVVYNPVVLKPPILKALSSAGVAMINFGIQTGSDYIRNNIFLRPEKNSEIIQLAKVISSYKIKIKYDLILNNPYDTEQSLRDTIELLLQLPKPLFFHLHKLQHFPNYPLTKKALQDNKIAQEDTSTGTLCRETTRNWMFAPTLLPCTCKHILQNIIWLAAWNYTRDSTVKYAVFGHTLGSKLCLIYLSIKAIIFGKMFGIGGLTCRSMWFSYIINTVVRILKGNSKTACTQDRKRIILHG